MNITDIIITYLIKMKRGYNNNSHKRHKKEIKNYKNLFEYVKNTKYFNIIENIIKNDTSDYTVLEKIILTYPNKNWTYYKLSYNPNISFKFILNNLNLKWAKEYLGDNPNIYKNSVNMDIINHIFPVKKRNNSDYIIYSDSDSDSDENDRHPKFHQLTDDEYDGSDLEYYVIDEESFYERDPYYDGICQIREIHQMIKEELISQEYIEANKFEYTSLHEFYESINTMYYIYPDICAKQLYNYYKNRLYNLDNINTIMYVLTNLNNIDMVIKSYENYDYFIVEKKFYNELSKIEYINSDILKRYVNKPWNYKKLSKLDGCIDYAIETYDKYDWNWNMLSKSKHITIKHLIKYPHIKWNISIISTAGNKITISDIFNNPQYNWNYLFCFVKRINNFNFNLNTLKKIINLFESIILVNNLNFTDLITDSKYYIRYLKPLSEYIYFSLVAKSCIIRSTSNKLFDSNNKLNGLYLLNFTYFLNSKYINLESINYILSNYMKYINVKLIKFKTPEITFDLLCKYKFSAKKISNNYFTYDREYYKYVLQSSVSNSHIIITNLSSVITEYI